MYVLIVSEEKKVVCPKCTKEHWLSVNTIQRHLSNKKIHGCPEYLINVKKYVKNFENFLSVAETMDQGPVATHEGNLICIQKYLFIRDFLEKYKANFVLYENNGEENDHDDGE